MRCGPERRGRRGLPNEESFSIRGDGQFKGVTDIENTVVTSDADGTPVLVKNLGMEVK